MGKTELPEFFYIIQSSSALSYSPQAAIPGTCEPVTLTSPDCWAFRSTLLARLLGRVAARFSATWARRARTPAASASRQGTVCVHDRQAGTIKANRIGMGQCEDHRVRPEAGRREILTIRDRDTVGERCRSLGRNVLSSLDQVGLEHDTHNLVARLALAELASNVLSDEDLVLVLLARVAVRAVDHDLLDEPGLGELVGDGRDVLGCVVGSRVGSSEDDVRSVVALRLDDGGQTLLVDREESVGRSGGSDGVDSDADGSVLQVK